MNYAKPAARHLWMDWCCVSGASCIRTPITFALVYGWILPKISFRFFSKSFLPPHSMALRVAMKCIPHQGWDFMEHQSMRQWERNDKGWRYLFMCNSTSMFEEGSGHQYRVCQLTSMNAEMFPSPVMHDNLSEFFLMDVILNHKIEPTWRNMEVAESDPDSGVVLVMGQSYGDGDLVDDMDFKHRTLVAFVRGAWSLLLFTWATSVGGGLQ